MQKIYDLPGMQKRAELNIKKYEAGLQSEISVANVQVELLQRMAEKVVRDTEELTARIKKEAEAEATRIIADATRIAQSVMDKAQKQAEAALAAEEKAQLLLEQARQKAMLIEAEATSEAMRNCIKIGEDIKNDLNEVLSKIHNEPQFPLEATIKSIEEELSEPEPVNESSTNMEISEAVLEPEPQLSLAISAENTGEQNSLETTVTSAPTDLSPDQPETAKVNIADAVTTSAVSSVVNYLQLFEGKVEIDIAPPINMARLLVVTRYLENTLDIKVLKTSASWNSGIKVMISLDKPLPLIKLLKEMPRVEEAKLVEDQSHPAEPGKNGFKKISVILGKDAD